MAEQRDMKKAAATFLPYGRHLIEDDDIAAVIAAMGGDFLTTGPLVADYERKFAEATGAKHAVACNSGTAALHLAVLALGLGPGDAAIVPTMTFLATANVVRMTGAEVIFADVDPDSGLLTAQSLEAAIEQGHKKGQKVKAALPVHLNGQLCAMSALAAVANSAGIELIEDACHALGVPDVGATRHSSLACFSTHPVKAVATGEGGMVTTSDLLLAERMRRLRTHGMVREASAFKNRALGTENRTPNPWYYEMHELGWNYRLPDVLCAMGISQLKKLPRFHKRRVEIAAMYDRFFSDLTPSVCPISHGARPHGWHLYALLVDFQRVGMSRAQFMRALKEKGIGSQVHYIPVHLQPYYSERYGAFSLPGAESYYSRCLSIPIYPGMTDGDVEKVASGLADIVNTKNS